MHQWFLSNTNQTKHDDWGHTVRNLQTRWCIQLSFQILYQHIGGNCSEVGRIYWCINNFIKHKPHRVGLKTMENLHIDWCFNLSFQNMETCGRLLVIPQKWNTATVRVQYYHSWITTLKAISFYRSNTSCYTLTLAYESNPWTILTETEAKKFRLID